MNYEATYAALQADPVGVWEGAARDIDRFEPARSVFNPALGVYGRWFDGAVPKVIVLAFSGIAPGWIVAYKPLMDEAISVANAVFDLAARDVSLRAA